MSILKRVNHLSSYAGQNTFIQSSGNVDGVLKKSVLLVENIQPPLSDLQWATLQPMLEQPNPPLPDPLPDPWDPDAAGYVELNNRNWNLDFDAIYDSELNPPDRDFMDSLRAELVNTPYGARRDWKDVKGVVIRAKNNGGRLE